MKGESKSEMDERFLDDLATANDVDLDLGEK